MHWSNRSAAHHVRVRRFVRNRARAGRLLGLTPQVLLEFIHIVTDPRRLSEPFTMPEAGQIAADLWNAQEVARIVPGVKVVGRTVELLLQFGLGRKSVLDTALAATLEDAGVGELATLNGADFKIFPFLETVDPTT